MSDTSNPGPAPTNNAPPSNPAPTNNAPPVNPSVAREVPIDREPVARPNPLGPQTPDKPVAEARREAVQRAFDRANKTAPPAEKTPPRAPPKAAEAKPGHNQPPDETPPERFDLRKRPTDDQPRDRGRFAPRAPREEGQPAAAAVPGRAPGVPGQAQKPGWQSLPETEPFRQPPARMSEQAKAEWHTTPASVRADLNRMQDEFVKAYRVYKNDFDEMSKIRHFHKMATDHGTTLAQALTNYVGMEQKLRADPVAGLDVIVNNLNLRTPDGQKLGLRDIAYHVLSQSPEQLRQLQMGNQDRGLAADPAADAYSAAVRSDAVRDRRFRRQPPAF
jgi:hypothetical protein